MIYKQKSSDFGRRIFCAVLALLEEACYNMSKEFLKEIDYGFSVPFAASRTMETAVFGAAGDYDSVLHFLLCGKQCFLSECSHPLPCRCRWRNSWVLALSPLPQSTAPEEYDVSERMPQVPCRCAEF